MIRKSYFLLKISIDKIAIDKMEPGEAVIIFTPDSKYTNYLFFSKSASSFVLL